VCFAPASRSALCKVSKFVVYSGWLALLKANTLGIMPNKKLS
jgi:hypothetical protein